jgi:putative DNA primase/helicase
MSDEKNFNLNQELDAKSSELEIQRKEMLKKGVKLTLQDIVDKVESHTAEITALMIGKIQKAKLQNLAACVIAEGADGRVRVPAFSEQNDKTSPVWVFVGTHWEVIDIDQIFFDFIRDACTKMGLGMEFVDDVPFFRKLKKQVEWKLSRHTETEEDENTVLVNFINGTLAIHRDGTRYIRPHRREDFFRYVLPYCYDPLAECPRFLQCMDEVLPDQGVHKPILEYIASCLVPWLHEEKVMAFLGSGSNGKSILIKTIEKLFGENGVAHENLYDLTRDEVHRANIEGKLINVATENDGCIKSAAFKTLASREPISCKRLYSQPYTMKQYARLLFAFNEMPKIKGGHANMRRWLLVKFVVRISEDQADLELEEKLARELSGIMNLVLDVLPDLLKRKKFSKSEAMEQAVRELEIGNDDVLQFIDDRCETNTATLTKGTELFKAFCEYCQQNKLPEITIREFYRRLEEKYQSKPDGHQKAFNIKVVRYE